MSTRDGGLSGAVNDAAPRTLGMFPDAVQLNLLREETGGSIDTAGMRQLRTGPGRRPGSRNKRNAKTAQLIVQRYGDPIDALGNFASMPIEDAVAMLRHADNPNGDDELDQIMAAVTALSRNLSDKTSDELARALMKFMARKQISALDVATMQIRVNQDLATYVHGRQPVAVEVRQKTDAVLIIPGINAPTGIGQDVLKDAVDQHGLDAIDFEQMRLVAPPVDAEFSEVGSAADTADEDEG